MIRVIHVIHGKADINRPNGVNQVLSGYFSSFDYKQIELLVFAKSSSIDKNVELLDKGFFKMKIIKKFGLTLLFNFFKDVKESDLVHFHGVYLNLNVLLSLICRYHRIPYIITLHDGLAPERQKRKKYIKIFYNYFFNRPFILGSSGIHCISNEESTELYDNFKYRKYVFNLMNGVDDSCFASYQNFQNLNIDGSEPLVFGYLGRISQEKNIIALLDALELLYKSYTFKFKLAGPNSKLLDIILSKQYSFKIEYCGELYGLNKINFIQSLDLFVHPSRCDVFSIAAIEVMALGIPLLITRTSDVAYFYDSKAFFMCEPSVYGLYNGLMSALKNRYSWSIMTNNARDLVTRELNWRYCAKRMLSEYKQVLILTKESF